MGLAKAVEAVVGHLAVGLEMGMAKDWVVKVARAEDLDWAMVGWVGMVEEMAVLLLVGT